MLNRGKAYLDEQMSIVILCCDMGWTYQEYLSQPEWFLDLLRIKRNFDAEYSNKELRKVKK